MLYSKKKTPRENNQVREIKTQNSDLLSWLKPKLTRDIHT